MPITRTAMVDDDGSGTTGTIINNAWKQEFYNQIDALAGAPVLAWTPVDASGAGLVFTVNFANYVRIGKLVTVTLYLTYPATSNGANAQIGGLPFAAQGVGGLYTAYGVTRTYHIQATATSILPMNPTTAAQYTNANMSGGLVVVAGLYHTSAA